MGLLNFYYDTEVLFEVKRKPIEKINETKNRFEKSNKIDKSSAGRTNVFQHKSKLVVFLIHWQ